MRGQSPREKPPHQGRWPRSRPEGFRGWRRVTVDGWRRKARRSPSGLASSASSPLRGAPFARAKPAGEASPSGEVAAKQAGRALDVSGGGGVKTPPYEAKDKRVVMARLRAGHARLLRNMVKLDVGRPDPRPPGRFAARRSHAGCRCRGRRPRRPAEVGGGGRCTGGMKPSPTVAR